MEHYKSRDNDFFHFTNPHDDISEFDDDDYDNDNDDLQYYDVDDDRSCEFNFHTLHPLWTTQSRFQTSGVMNQNDAVEEFGTFDNEALVFELDNTMKKLCDEVQQTIVGIGAQISRLEDETCKLDKCVENVKNSEDTYHGTTHRKLKHMQSILEEVQDDVLFLRDKHEIAETQLQLAALQGSKRDKITPMNRQQHVPLPAPQSSCHTPFAAHVSQLPPNELILSETHDRPTFPQAPEITVQKYLIPPNQTPHQNQPEPLYPNFTQSYQQISFQSAGRPQNSPFLSHRSQKTPNRPSYSSYFSGVQHFPSDPAIWDYTQDRKVNFPQSTHVQTLRNHNYMPKFASFSDIPPDGKLPSLHEISDINCVGFSLNSQEQSSTSNYTDTPVQQALPHALPTAVDVEDGSSSGENDNTIRVDDIVDKVTAMGFRRDHVKASMRKMTQNGSPVNLNSVLDRMMNNK